MPGCNLRNATMPVYVYGCEACGHTFEKLMKIAERHIPCEEKCEKCGEANYNIRPTALHVSASVMTNLKPPDGFKDVLKRVKKNHKGSTIDV